MNILKGSSDWRLKLDSLLGVATIFLMVATVVAVVEFFNRLKENQYIGVAPPAQHEIMVSGRAERFVSPDLAQVNLGVSSEAKTVEQAMGDNTRKMNAVISFLKQEIGLSEKDIKTTQFSLSPRYEWRELGRWNEGERVLVGYEVSQVLEVKIRNFELIGEIIQGAAEKGANQVGHLSFSVENQESIRAEVRAEAITQAKDKAKILADQLGIRLKRLTNFSEDSPVVSWARDMAAGYLKAPQSTAPSIEPGENKIEVNVSITYEIN